MAKSGGRARVKAGDKVAGKAPETRQIRVPVDLADKLGWIVHVRGGSVSRLVEDWLRARIEARYKRIESAVEILKRKRARAEHQAPADREEAARQAAEIKEARRAGVARRRAESAAARKKEADRQLASFLRKRGLLPQGGRKPKKAGG